MKLYKLDSNKNPIPCSIDEWSMDTRRIVRKNRIGGVEISTVFLGMDHSHGGPVPILFETMIFGGKYDGYQVRYETWEQSEKGHEEACFMVDKISIEREKKLGDLGL